MYRYSYGYGRGMMFDATYILVLIGALLCIIASAMVKSTYNKYAKIRSMSGMTGAQVATEILRRNGINDVAVVHVPGNLSDHFDPRNNTVNLSDSTYNSTSVAAIGVAAHECGHVMQHHTGYVPIKIRSTLVPAANIGSHIGIPIIILGLIIGMTPLAKIGIWVFSLAVAFQLVTLPVEFDASHRALVMLGDYGILADDEVDQSRKVLNAAALTYVAAAASSILQLLRLVLMVNGGNRNRR
ncbi:zinc metallopeptidase [Butyrivibrio sp. WCD2001]|uniref:zinc metallopeptidase n=1 Tax=Butyrivibrio sp. WCD2001 TaxID=1280681 RepID=UPI0003F7495B|nr:zinc metallopeptidase [Butyrivibrio sp. WCD2001]